MFEAWREKWGEKDLELYDPVAVEEPITIQFPNLPGFHYTCRPDVVLKMRKRPHYTYIGETKTSSSSWKLTELGVVNSDQSTTYLYAVKSKYPELNVMGIIPDISYWNKQTEDTKNILSLRPQIVERSERDITEFVIGTSSVLVDLSARMQALERGEHHPVALFPRCTQRCADWFRHCEYMPICRIYETIKTSLPVGFEKDPWAEEREVLAIQPKLKGGGKGAKSRRKPAPAVRPGKSSKRKKSAQSRKS